jgi:hypothetical protein
LRAEWSGPAKDTPQSIPAGLINGFWGTRLKEEQPRSGQRKIEALTDEPTDLPPALANGADRTNPTTTGGLRYGVSNSRRVHREGCNETNFYGSP